MRLKATIPLKEKPNKAMEIARIVLKDPRRTLKIAVSKISFVRRVKLTKKIAVKT